MDNLATLCWFHHTCVHERGFRIKRDPDGTFVFATPDGNILPTCPTVPPVAGDAAGELKRRHAVAGLTLTAETAFPQWDGEPVDYEWATMVMLNLRAPDSPEPDPPRMWV